MVLIYIGTGAEGVKSAFAIFYLLLKFHNAIFMGIVGGVTPDIEDATTAPYFKDCMLECIIYTLIPLITVAFAHFAYTMGTKDRKIFGKNK